MLANVLAEYLNHTHHFADIECSFLLKVRLVGKHLVALLHEHVGIGTTPGSEVHRALVLLQGRQHIVLVKRGRDKAGFLALQSVHLAMELVVRLYAQGIVVILTVVDGKVAHHLFFLLPGNHVDQTRDTQLLASYGVVGIEQDAPLFITHHGAPTTITHDKSAHSVNDEGICIALELDALVFQIAVRLGFEFTIVQIQRDRGLVGFNAVVEKVEADFIGAGNTLQANSRAMRQPDGFHGAGALVASGQDAILTVDDNRLNHTELPQALLQKHELLLVQMARVVIRRFQLRQRIVRYEFSFHGNRCGSWNRRTP